MTSTRMMRMPEVMAVTGLSRTRLYELERAGKFPARRKLSERATAWRADEVDAWINSRPKAGGQAA